MPLFMDFHKIEGITIGDVISAHMADLSVQEKFGVKYHQFWVNEKAGTVFCLTEGPDAATCELVHRMAHGNLPCAITEVEAGTYKVMMGETTTDDHGLVKNEDGTVDLGYRHILVASLRAITNANHSSDLQLLQIPHWAKASVAENFKIFNGRSLKWAYDDSLIAVFNDATQAVKCAQQIHRELQNAKEEPKVVFKIGISSDQPVTKNGDFFTKAITLAHRLGNTAAVNHIVVSSMVKKLCLEEIPSSSDIRYLESSDEQFVSDLLEITDQNLSNNRYSIETMCKDIGISRPQLYRKITSLTGRAPNDFLRDIRLEKALTLLKQRSGNISQVALEVGYNNPSYFSKCFSEKFGCVPSQVSATQL